jgi:hypothetical protein
MSDAEPELPQEREALCILPAYLGRDYAMASVPGGFLRFDLREALMDIALQMEACRRLGEKPYLDKDHDFRSKLFTLERACLVEKEGIFGLGHWTKEGLRLRSSYQGVSHSCVEYSKKYPPPAEYLEAKKKQIEEMNKTLTPDADFLGSLGCVCIDESPTFPGTIKTLPLDGASDDELHLLYGFNSTRITWPPVLTTADNGTVTNELTTDELKDNNV